MRSASKVISRQPHAEQFPSSHQRKSSKEVGPVGCGRKCLSETREGTRSLSTSAQPLRLNRWVTCESIFTQSCPERIEGRRYERVGRPSGILFQISNSPHEAPCPKRSGKPGSAGLTHGWMRSSLHAHPWLQCTTRHLASIRMCRAEKHSHPWGP